ncbi:glycoside hydrolase family 20 protein [Streptomyces sp. NPDC049954]|uniref:beta-N-acetylhexosaminidase n=1 Tax=Streptomyces sp. NPDC049954 TaxID=3155779 RepID=UPI003421DB15
MANHRRQDPAPRDGGRRRRALAAAGGAVVVAAALVVGFTVWPGGGGSDDGSERRDSASPGEPATPASAFPVSKAPRSLPTVREHEAARGPGWTPGSDGRVLVSDAGLADEGKLLASELKLSYGGEKKKPRRGDVSLVLDSKAKGGEESYTMTVRDGQVRISGPAQAGVFYGTRTLKQTVHADKKAPEGVVRDAPAKPQRGFALDIARKTYGLDWIKDRVRELGDLKYNQLGLHFSDDQAFRIESSSHPEIVSEDHFSKDEIRSVVRLAESRHIAVVPEIDSPGHLGTVIKAHPDLQLRDVQGRAVTGAVDVSDPKAAKIVDDLLKEYAPLFPGPYWNLGADEYQALVRSDPEASFPQLAALARKKYGARGRVQDLATDWLNARAKTVRDARKGRSLKAWNDGFFAGGQTEADKDIQVIYWTGKEIGARQPTEYLAAGRKLVNYNDEYLYYVLGQPNTFRYPTGQRIYEQWTPLVVRGSTPVPAKYDDQILGGTFAVWGDLPNAQTEQQVADGIRMPLRAFIEKLWPAKKPDLTWAQFTELSKAVG